MHVFVVSAQVCDTLEKLCSLCFVLCLKLCFVVCFKIVHRCVSLCVRCVFVVFRCMILSLSQNPKNMVNSD